MSTCSDLTDRRTDR